MLGLGALEAALGLWDGIDGDGRTKSAALFDILRGGRSGGLECATPAIPARGSHIVWPRQRLRHHAGADRAREIGDFRDPDVLRLGRPAHLSHVDV